MFKFSVKSFLSLSLLLVLVLGLTLACQNHAYIPDEGYKITLLAGEGSGVRDNDLSNKAGDYVLPEGDPFVAPAHKRFLGWKFKDNPKHRETMFTGKKINVNKPTTLIAQWFPTQQVRYTLNNGTNEKKDTDTVDRGSKYTITGIDGYTNPRGKILAGWRRMVGSKLVGDILKPGEALKVLSDIHLVAQWGDRRVLQFTPGAGRGKNFETSVATGSKYNLPDLSDKIKFNPPRTSPKGTSFIGWKLLDQAGNPTGKLLKAGSSISVNSDASYAAQWSGKRFLDYVPGEGSGKKVSKGYANGAEIALIGLPTHFSAPKEAQLIGTRKFIGWKLVLSIDETQVLAPLAKAGTRVNISQNMKAIALWSPVYTVSFVTEGPNKIPSRKVASGSVYTVDVEAAAKNKKAPFSHWLLDQDNIKAKYEKGDKFTVTNDTKLTAIYAERKSIRYLPGKGSGSMPADTLTSIDKGTIYVLPNNDGGFNPPQGLDGVKFSGWSVQIGDKAPVDMKAGKPFLVSDDVVVTAKWSPAYDVSLDNDGDGNVDKTTKVAEGNDYTTPEAPAAAQVPVDKSFGGWIVTDKDSGKSTLVPADTNVEINGPTLVKPKWLDLLIISFDHGEGTGSMPQDKVSVGDNYTLPASAFTSPASNRDFKGWKVEFEGDTKPAYEHPLGAGLKLSKLSKNTKLTAIWNDLPVVAQKQKINYRPGKGSGSMPADTVTSIDKGATYILPNNDGGFVAPTDPDGIKFTGWMVKIGNRPSEFMKPGKSFVADRDVVVTAKWSPVYEVELDKEGDGTTDKTTKVASGNEYTTPAAPSASETPAGKTFGGWEVTGRDGKTLVDPNTPVVITGHTKVQPKWLDLLEISFVAGEGSGTMPIVKLLEGEDYTLPASSFTKPAADRDFIGWKVEFEGETKPAYARLGAGMKLPKLAKNTKLTALWKDLAVSVEHKNIRFEAGAGTGSMPADTITTTEKGATYILPNNDGGFDAPSTPEGVEFIGWSVKIGDKDPVDMKAGKSFVVSDDVVVTAKWSPVYDVSFDKEGDGTVDTTTPVAEGKEYTTPAEPEASQLPVDKSFGGWIVTDKKSGKTIVVAPGTKVEINGPTEVKPKLLGLITISFKPGEGSGSKAQEKIVAETDYTLPANSFTSPAADRKFIGWKVEFEGDSTPAYDKIIAGLKLPQLSKNTTLTAVWSDPPVVISNQNIRFEAGEGSGSMPSDTLTIIKKGESYVLPNNDGGFDAPTAPEGREFIGWSVKIGDKDPVDMKEGTSFIVNDDVVVTAKWSPVYDVSLDNEGDGTIDKTTPIADGKNYTTPAAPDASAVPADKSFGGWKVTDKNGDTTIVEPSTQIKITGATKVEPKWINLLQIRYDNGGGKGSKNQDHIAVGEDFTLIANPFEAPSSEHRFAGWEVRYEGDATPAYTHLIAGIKIPNLTKNTLLTAQWEDTSATQNTEMVDIIFEGGESISGAIEALQQAKNSTFKLPKNLPPAAGFDAPADKSFVGWKVVSTEDPSYVISHLALEEEVIPVDRDLTVIAQWKNLRFITVWFDNNGGSGVKNEEKIPAGTRYKLPAVATFTPPEGASFNGWHVVTKADETYEIANFMPADSFLVFDDDVLIKPNWYKPPVPPKVNIFLINSQGIMRVDSTDKNSSYELPDDDDLETYYKGSNKTLRGWRVNTASTGEVLLPGQSIDVGTVDIKLYAQDKEYVKIVFRSANTSDFLLGRDEYGEPIRKRNTQPAYTIVSPDAKLRYRYSFDEAFELPISMYRAGQFADRPEDTTGYTEVDQYKVTFAGWRIRYYGMDQGMSFDYLTAKIYKPGDTITIHRDGTLNVGSTGETITWAELTPGQTEAGLSSEVGIEPAWNVSPNRASVFFVLDNPVTIKINRFWQYYPSQRDEYVRFEDRNYMLVYTDKDTELKTLTTSDVSQANYTGDGPNSGSLQYEVSTYVPPYWRIIGWQKYSDGRVEETVLSSADRQFKNTAKLVGSTEGEVLIPGSVIEVTASEQYYKAIWEHYSVINFSPGAAFGEMDSITVDRTKPYVLPYPAMRGDYANSGFVAPEGMEFAGWEVPGGAIKQPGESIDLSDDELTLFATWKPLVDVERHVFIHFNEGARGNGTMPSREFLPHAIYNVEASLFTPATPNTVFIGWKINNEGDLIKPGEQLQLDVNDVTLYAQWDFLPTITYRIGGGTYVKADQKNYVKAFKKDSNYRVLSNLNPELGYLPPVGKSFDYWSLKQGRSTQERQATKGEEIQVSDDIVLTAHWKDLPLFDLSGKTVQIAFQGGEAVDGEMPSVEERKRASYTLPENRLPQGFEAPDGKVFVGWKVVKTADMSQVLSSLEKPGDIILVKDNITCIAQWALRRNLTISFEANNATSESKNSDTIELGEAYTLPVANTFSAPEGFRFKGWSIVLSDDPRVSVADFVDPEAPFYFDQDVLIAPRWEALPDAQITVVLVNDEGVLRVDRVAKGSSYVIPDGDIFGKNQVAPINPDEDDQKARKVGDAKTIIGWRRDAAHSGDLLKAGETITIGSKDIKLYAQYREYVQISFTVDSVPPYLVSGEELKRPAYLIEANGLKTDYKHELEEDFVLPTPMFRVAQFADRPSSTAVTGYTEVEQYRYVFAGWRVLTPVKEYDEISYYLSDEVYQPGETFTLHRDGTFSVLSTGATKKWLGLMSGQMEAEAWELQKGMKIVPTWKEDSDRKKIYQILDAPVTTKISRYWQYYPEQRDEYVRFEDRNYSLLYAEEESQLRLLTTEAVASANYTEDGLNSGSLQYNVSTYVPPYWRIIGWQKYSGGKVEETVIDQAERTFKTTATVLGAPEGDVLAPDATIDADESEQYYKAVWEHYSVITFSPRDMSGSMLPAKVDRTKPYILPVPIMRGIYSDEGFSAPDNMAFAGWEVPGGEIKQPGDTIDLSDDEITLYAIWRQGEVRKNLWVHYNEGAYGNGDMASIQFNPEATFSVPTCRFYPVVPNKKFVGWKIEGIGELIRPGAKLKLGEQNITLYAQWGYVADASSLQP